MFANLSQLELLQANYGHSAARSPMAVFNAISDEDYQKAQSGLQDILNVLKKPEWQGRLSPTQRQGLQKIGQITSALMLVLKRWKEEEDGQPFSTAPTEPTDPVNPS